MTYTRGKVVRKCEIKLMLNMKTLVKSYGYSMLCLGIAIRLAGDTIGRLSIGSLTLGHHLGVGFNLKM